MYSSEYHVSTTPLANGKYHLHWETDDNYDLGYPSKYAIDDYSFDTLEKLWRFVRGKPTPPENSWYGTYGQPIALFIDGLLMPFPDDGVLAKEWEANHAN